MIKTVLVLSVLAFGRSAWAENYRCRGNSVETGHGQATTLTIRGGGNDVQIENKGRMLGHMIKRGSQLQIEVNYTIVATFDGSKINPRRGGLVAVSSAKSKFQCQDSVAAVLWAIDNAGKWPRVEAKKTEVKKGTKKPKARTASQRRR